MLRSEIEQADSDEPGLAALSGAREGSVPWEPSRFGGIVLVSYVLIVVAFESLIGFFQPEGPDTLVLTTVDEDGVARERRRFAFRGSSLGYDAFWLDEGTTWQPSRRTSLIVDPPSGSIPYLPTARDHERPYGAGPWNSHLDLDTGEWCFGDGFPQIWFGDNPNHQIFQTDLLLWQGVVRNHLDGNRVATYFLASSSPSRTEPGPVRT